MAILLVDSQPHQFSKARGRYALSQILDILGYFYRFSDEAQDDPIATELRIRLQRLHYGDPDEASAMATVVIPEQADTSIEELLTWLGRPAEAQYAQSPSEHGPIWRCQFDLVRAAFYLLSRQEEMEATVRDKMGRFIGANSVLARLRLLERPVLNEALNGLDQAIMGAAAARPGLLLKKAAWPHPYRYAGSLTHDVDELGYRDLRFGVACLGQFVRTGRLHALKKGGGTIAQWGSNKLSGRAYPREYLDEWRRFEDELGLRSSFYFVSAARNKSSYDPNYDVAEPRLRSKIEELTGQGWEVGVHGSFDSYDCPDCLAEERERLATVVGRDVIGVRQHYLRFRAPETWAYQQAAGFQYDATLGLRDRLGFRAGLAAPFAPYDWQNEEPFDLLELPLSVMDGVLFWRHRLSPEQALETTRQQIEAVKSNYGHWVGLWHHNARDLRRRPGWWSVYCDLASTIANDDACFIATMAEVHDWWRARQRLTVNKITVEGERMIVMADSPGGLNSNLAIDCFGLASKTISVSAGQRTGPLSQASGHRTRVTIPPLRAREEVVFATGG